MSKSSFANTDSNSLVQSGKVKSFFYVSEAQRAPSASFWEIVEVVCRSAVADSRSNLIMKSLSPYSYLTSHVWQGVSSSSESSTYSGGGPDQQMLMALASTFFHNACSFWITWHPLH